MVVVVVATSLLRGAAKAVVAQSSVKADIRMVTNQLKSGTEDVGGSRRWKAEKTVGKERREMELRISSCFRSVNEEDKTLRPTLLI